MITAYIHTIADKGEAFSSCVDQAVITYIKEGVPIQFEFNNKIYCMNSEIYTQLINRVSQAVDKTE